MHMLIQFINRVEELKFLESLYKEEGCIFIPIYGRRRVGKTELIKVFIKDKPHVYFLADSGNEAEQLKRISYITGQFFNDASLLSGLYFRNWNDFFTYLGNKEFKKKFVLVIDEFPYLVYSNKGISSIFQLALDEVLKHKNIFLILCGSSIGMMEKEVLFYKAPLYGRRSGQLKLEPLKFGNINGFLPKYDIKNEIIAYSILGGIPAYLTKFSDDIDIFVNISEKFFDKNSVLYSEAEILLKEELREPNLYFSILKALSFGKNKLSEIANEIDEPRTSLPRYLLTLENLGFIKKAVSIDEKHLHKSRKGIYKISDNYLSFWFRFIYPNKSYIEEGKTEFVLQNVKKYLPSYVSFVFEDICKEFIKQTTNFVKVGSWWHKDNEIDIVAIDEDKKEILFVECQWKEETMQIDIVKNLKEKSELVNWNNKNRKERFALFSKSGFSKKCLDYCKENNIKTFDLKGMKKYLMNGSFKWK